MAETKAIWSSDLYKGFKTKSAQQLKIDDLLPFQMLEEKDKGPDWIRAVADFYETAGWVNVEKNAYHIQKNFDLRNSKLNASDYIVGPSYADYYSAVGIDLPFEAQSPIQQFYPIIPNLVDLLRGEYIKRDNSMVIEAIDPYSVGQAFQYKEEEFKDVIMSFAMQKKQMEMMKLGIVPSEEDPEMMAKFQQEMQNAQKRMMNVEMKSKTFRTTGQQWAEKVSKIHEQRYNLHELEPDGFETMLVSDRAFYHIDLLEDDFKLELLNPKWCDYHKGPNVKYVSEGDYFLWFDFMSAGDIVNKFGTRMELKDMEKLKEVYLKTANLVVPDSQRAIQGSYYDMSKSWTEATALDQNMNNALLGKELAYTYMRSPNFDHNQDVDILNPVWGRRVTGKPQMFRTMRLYWKSMRKIGWLTKINRDGSPEPPDWIDEHYKVTEEPVYDHSLVKDKKKDNLLYGEHIDWTWVSQWRHVIKISPNQKHTFWMNWNDTFETIYLDGGPVKFQFKGDTSPYNCLPPIEGCEFTWMNSGPNSFVDRIKPKQILYNICMNKVPKKILEDFGLKLGVHDSYLGNNSLSAQSEQNRQQEFEEKLRESPIFSYSTDMETLRALGQPPIPQVLNMSTVQDAQFYFNLASFVKESAGEDVGITRQRTANMKASETATGINQAINYSETQTEKYFDNYSNLMQRVRQRMLDAAQYYSTFKESSREVYINSMDENVFLQMEGMKNLLPHYLIKITSKANIRAALNQIKQFLFEENTLPIKASEKVEAMLANSQSKILSLFRRGEEEQILREEEQREFEERINQQKTQSAEKMQSEKLAWDAEQKQFDRESQEEIARIRALGGIQTDVDMDGQIDAAQNQLLLKQQELSYKQKEMQNKSTQDRQMHNDNMMLEREKMMTDLEKEKLKSDTAKFVAKENKTNSELKKKSK